MSLLICSLVGMVLRQVCACAARHFVWSSVCYGYIIYDTLYEATRTLYEKAGNASFLLHHAIGLACCCVGLYLRRMAYFGAVIQVFFEATTPFMHALGCMKTMGWDNSDIYAATGMLLSRAWKLLLCWCCLWPGCGAGHVSIRCGRFRWLGSG